MNYIRVAANVSDLYTKVTKVYSVAFKSTDSSGLSGPYGNVDTIDDTQKAALRTFVKAKIASGSPAVKRMFVPETNRAESDIGDAMEVISYHDKVFPYAHDQGTSPVESLDVSQSYYVYIYIENASEFNVIQPSSVYVES
jgi:hypothetical protein